MSKVYVLAILATASLMTFCSPTSKTAESSTIKQRLNSKSFHKIFIEVATIDVEVRNNIEKSLAATIISEGYAAVRSIDMLPFSFNELMLPTKGEIEMKVKECGCDAILIVSLIRKEDAIKYNSGTSINRNPQILAGILGMVLKSGGNATPISAVNIPGSYSHEGSNFVIQSNFVDALTEEVIYSFQSENIDILSFDNLSKTYSAILIDHLKKEKLLVQSKPH